MTTTTLDTRTLRTAGGAWVPAAPVDRRSAITIGGGQRLLAAFALATAITIALILVLGLLAAPGGEPASASGSAPAHLASDAPSIHVAHAGDSLWAIAVEHHGSVDLDRYLETLIRLNGGTVIHAGQAVRLP